MKFPVEQCHCDEIRTGESIRRPLFSIVVGLYNHADKIPELVRALQEQSCQDFEVQWCDDGSPDGSLEAARANVEWNEDGTKRPGEFVARHQFHWQKNKGMRLAKSLNRGIRAARGEYCVFIMGDSLPDPDYLAHFARFVRPHRVLCGIRYQIDEGRGVDVDWRIKKGVIPQVNAMLMGGGVWNMITGNGLVVPTAAMRTYGGWNEKVKGYGGDDNELAARLFFRGFTLWSITDAVLYHHWHRTQGENPKNDILVSRLIAGYAA